MTKILNIAYVFTAFCATLIVFSCGENKAGGVNLFSVKQDQELGAQLKDEINSNPDQYPVLAYAGNEKAYNYLYAMRDAILGSDVINYRQEFGWELYIIKDDATLNAFCAPGGYMYVYTGLIKYLDQADHLAGVIGHEIAHADQRHSTKQMTKSYGLQILVSIIAGGDKSQLAEIAAGLATLSFSRAHEKDADSHSVEYLCDTKYAANGAAAFFEKLVAEGQGGGTPAFLSTHPNPGNRVQSINAKATADGCSTALSTNSGYQNFKEMMPR